MGLHNLSVALESANKMNYNDTVVLTSTLYDNSPEGIARSQAARVFLENSSLTGIRIVMCDGGSGTDFLDFVRGFPNVTLLEYHNNPVLQKSHAPRRKHGMQYILEHFPYIHFILWTEPEKADILLPQNLSKVINPLRENKADQTIPTPKPNDRVSIDFSYADSQLNDEINPDRILALKRKRIEQYRTLIRAFREEFMKIL